MSYQLSFYVPKGQLDEVKQAIFATGAGSIGHYAECAWQTLGTGCFMPLHGHHAFIGETDQLEQVEEYKVEIMCEKNQIKEAVAALKNTHPYEEPSYQVILLEDF